MKSWDLVKEAGAIAGAALTIITVVGWLVKPRVTAWFHRQVIRPLQETHHSVTVNGHQSDEPTLRDQVDDLTEQSRTLMRRAQTNADGIESIRDELREHGDQSRAAMAIYRKALADQNIHLPVAPGEDGYGAHRGDDHG